MVAMVCSLSVIHILEGGLLKCQLYVLYDHRWEALVGSDLVG